MLLHCLFRLFSIRKVFSFLKRLGLFAHKRQFLLSWSALKVATMGTCLIREKVCLWLLVGKYLSSLCIVAHYTCELVDPLTSLFELECRFRQYLQRVFDLAGAILRWVSILVLQWIFAARWSIMHVWLEWLFIVVILSELLIVIIMGSRRDIIRLWVVSKVWVRGFYWRRVSLTTEGACDSLIGRVKLRAAVFFILI